MLVSEEELTVEVAQVDGVQIDDLNLTEAGKGKVFQEFASYTTCAYKKHASLRL